MKKLLAVFCSLALFSVSLFSTGIFTQNVSAEAEATEERFFHSFATAEDYAASKAYVNPNGTNITLSYDETEGALKAVPTTPGKGNHQIRLDPAQGNTAIDVAEYPVIAVKIKFNNTVTPNFGGINIGTNKSTRPSGSTSGYFSYEKCQNASKTGDWQLIVYDGTNDVWKQSGDANGQFCGKYEGLIYLLTANNQTTTANDVYWIQWAGAFKTLEEVYAYEDEMVSPFFYDFSNEDVTNKTLASPGSLIRGENKAFSYDAEKQALKLDANDGANTAGWFKPQAYRGDSTKVASYPVIAFKVMVNNKSRGFFNLEAGTTAAYANTGNYMCNLTGNLGATHSVSGGWQLIIFDATDLVNTNANFGGTYTSLAIQFMTNGTTATANDIWWIEWAGVFKTVEDVYAYNGTANSSFFYDFTDKDSVEGLIKANTKIANESGHGNKFAYSEEQQALMVTPTAAASGNCFYIRPDTVTNLADYPYAAIKVKVTNKAREFGGIAPGTNHGGSPAGPLRFGYSGNGIFETDDWQIIVCDMTTANPNYAKGTWNSIYPNLATSAGTENDPVYIQWAGVFKTEEEAYAYDKGINAALVYDYTTSINNGRQNIGFQVGELNGSVSYSSEYTALKVTASNTNAVSHRLKVVNPKTYNQNDTNNIEDINIKDYPIFAVKIRANVESNLTCWAGTLGLDDAGTRKKGSMYTDNDKITSTTKVTDDWQIITFDYSTKLDVYKTAYGATVNYWDYPMLLLTPDNTAAPAGQEWDIQWVGMFGSVADAEAYDAVYFEDVNKKDAAKPSDEDTNVLFVGDSASAQLLNSEIKDVIGQDNINVNLGFLGATSLNAAVSKGTDNMQFTYMAKNNRLTYTDSKTNSDAVQDFADWDYVFVQAGDNTAELLASAGTHLATNGKTVAYTAAKNADTSALTAGLAEVFDLNRVLYAAATKYTTADTIYTANALTTAGNKLAALAINDYIIDGYKALDKAVTVYDASAITDTLIKATITLPLAGDADNSSVIDSADITAIRNQILGAAATDNADTDLNGDIDIIDAVRVAVFLG